MSKLWFDASSTATRSMSCTRGKTHRIRLLNVDTPETVDPRRPVQCLGPEASRFLHDRLPSGTRVRLRFDVDRQDRYDRELAGVFMGKALVNAEIARAGLGVAVLFEPNRRFYPDVLAAQEEAKRSTVGLRSAAVRCTLPARVLKLEQDADDVTEAALPPGADLATIDRRATSLATVLVASMALAAVIRATSLAFADGTYPEALRGPMTARVDVTIQTLNEATRRTATVRKQEVARVNAGRVAEKSAAR